MKILRRRRRVDLENDIKLLAWLHAELVYELTATLTNQMVNDHILAWLHTELVHELKTLIAAGLANPPRPEVVARAQKIAAHRAKRTEP